jgi:hypothetical protein
MLEQWIQNIVRTIDTGVGARCLRFFTLALAVLGLVVWYDLTAYRGFNSPEAMDAAQVARHLTEGKGYSTDFIRPFSLYLVRQHNQTLTAGAAPTTNTDFARINSPHPDLANAPLYPTVLAGLMELHPPNWKARTDKPFWAADGHFLRYQPEFAIAIFNQILLLAVAALTFLLAWKLFDELAAWLAALLVLGSEPLWRFSVSGLSTLLVLVIFLGLVGCLVKIEELGRAESPNLRKLFGWAVGAGLLVGAGMLTRYACGWLIVPVLLFLWLFSGVHRTHLAGAVLIAFVLVVSPWLARNLAVSGTWLGTAGYAIAEDTSSFPGTRLMQSMNPDLNTAHWIQPYLHKFMENTRTILQGDLTRVGGSWVAILFFAGLLLGLRNPAARRLRYFTMMCLGVLVIVQALGKTHLSSLSPEINSENLLVLLTPLAAIFAVVFFLTLLDQMKTPSLQIRNVVIALFAFITCLPLLTALLPPKSSPLSYPPYYPPEIQQVANWMQPHELMMSDIPWAVAWYGQRQCTWTTLNSQYEFSQLNDYSIKPVRGLYLSLNTLDSKLFTECLQGGVNNWGSFALKTVVANQIPKLFPLRVAPYGLTSGLFLTDRQRWPSE